MQKRKQLISRTRPQQPKKPKVTLTQAQLTSACSDLLGLVIEFLTGVEVASFAPTCQLVRSVLQSDKRKIPFYDVLPPNHTYKALCNCRGVVIHESWFQRNPRPDLSSFVKLQLHVPYYINLSEVLQESSPVEDLCLVIRRFHPCPPLKHVKRLTIRVMAFDSSMIGAILRACRGCKLESVSIHAHFGWLQPDSFEEVCRELDRHPIRDLSIHSDERPGGWLAHDAHACLYVPSLQRLSLTGPKMHLIVERLQEPLPLLRLDSSSMTSASFVPNVACLELNITDPVQEILVSGQTLRERFNCCPALEQVRIHLSVTFSPFHTYSFCGTITRTCISSHYKATGMLPLRVLNQFQFASGQVDGVITDDIIHAVRLGARRLALIGGNIRKLWDKPALLSLRNLQEVWILQHPLRCYVPGWKRWLLAIFDDLIYGVNVMIGPDRMPVDWFLTK